MEEFARHWFVFYAPGNSGHNKQNLRPTIFKQRHKTLPRCQWAVPSVISRTKRVTHSPREAFLSVMAAPLFLLLIAGGACLFYIEVSFTQHTTDGFVWLMLFLLQQFYDKSAQASFFLPTVWACWTLGQVSLNVDWGERRTKEVFRIHSTLSTNAWMECTYL